MDEGIKKDAERWNCVKRFFAEEQDDSGSVFVALIYKLSGENLTDAVDRAVERFE